MKDALRHPSGSAGEAARRYAEAVQALVTAVEQFIHLGGIADPASFVRDVATQLAERFPLPPSAGISIEGAARAGGHDATEVASVRAAGAERVPGTEAPEVVDTCRVDSESKPANGQQRWASESKRSSGNGVPQDSPVQQPRAPRLAKPPRTAGAKLRNAVVSVPVPLAPPPASQPANHTPPREPAGPVRTGLGAPAAAPPAPLDIEGAGTNNSLPRIGVPPDEASQGLPSVEIPPPETPASEAPAHAVVTGVGLSAAALAPLLELPPELPPGRSNVRPVSNVYLRDEAVTAHSDAAFRRQVRGAQWIKEIFTSAGILGGGRAVGGQDLSALSARQRDEVKDFTCNFGCGRRDFGYVRLAGGKVKWGSLAQFDRACRCRRKNDAAAAKGDLTVGGGLLGNELPVDDLYV
jgi:hypothetical protein